MTSERSRGMQVVVLSSEVGPRTVPGLGLRHLANGDEVVKVAAVGNIVLIIGQAELAALTPQQVARLAERRRLGALKLVVLADGDVSRTLLDGQAADAVVPFPASGTAIARAVERLAGGAPPSSRRLTAVHEYPAMLRSAGSEIDGTLQVSANGRMAFVSKRIPARGARARVTAPTCPNSLPAVVVGRVAATASGEFEAELLLDAPVEAPAGRAGSSPDVHGRRSRKVLLVDDSELIIALTTAVLTSAGYAVISTTSPFDARALIRTHSPDLVLIDFNIPALRGDVLIEIVKRDGIQTPMVLYSSAPDRVLADATASSGAFAYIRKGVNAEIVVKELDQIYKRLGRT